MCVCDTARKKYDLPEYVTKQAVCILSCLDLRKVINLGVGSESINRWTNERTNERTNKQEIKKETFSPSFTSS